MSDQMRLRPMVHVADMSAAVGFYEALGAEIAHGSRDGDWVLQRVAGGELGFAGPPTQPRAERGRGGAELPGDGAPITSAARETGFGRQLQLTTPEGLLIKIDELDPERFT